MLSLLFIDVRAGGAMKPALVLVCVGAVTFLVRVLAALIKECAAPRHRKVEAYLAKVYPLRKRGELIVMNPKCCGAQISDKSRGADCARTAACCRICDSWSWATASQRLSTHELSRGGSHRRQSATFSGSSRGTRCDEEAYRATGSSA